MKKLLLLPLAACALVSAVAVQVAFELKPNKENVVAARILGVWDLQDDRTHWLGASKDIRSLAFVQDDKLISEIPAKHKELIAGDVFLVGTVQRNQETLPFVLTVANGTPRIVMFRAEGLDKYAKAEPLNVMMCLGLERPKDMLFVGGAKNDRPFAMFIRRELAPEK